MREIVLQFTVKWHCITLRRALAKRRANRGETEVGGAARLCGVAWRRGQMIRRCACGRRQNLTLHDAFSAASSTDSRRSRRFDRSDSGGSGGGRSRRLDWLNGLPALLN